jgi:hypothetical protein
MNRINHPIWYQQISYQKKNGLISNGLTIPYLIGTYKLYGYQLIKQENPIEVLINDIVSSEIDGCAVLQKCFDIRQLVIKIESRNYCKDNYKTEIYFKNNKDNKSLIITQSASDLGKDLPTIINTLSDLFLENINHDKYSWNNTDKLWQEFNEKDIKIVLSAKESEK